MKLDAFGQLIAEKRFDSHMRPTAFETKIVQHLTKLRSPVAVVAGELHPLVAHLGYRLQHAGKVFGALLAYRIELKTNRYFCHCQLLGFIAFPSTAKYSTTPPFPRKDKRLLLLFRLAGSAILRPAETVGRGRSARLGLACPIPNYRAHRAAAARAVVQAATFPQGAVHKARTPGAACGGQPTVPASLYQPHFPLRAA